MTGNRELPILDPSETPPTGNEPNEFGKALTKVAVAAKPYTSQILLGLFTMIVVAAGTVFWLRSAEAKQRVGWDEFAKCQAPDDFLDLAKKYPGLPVGNWSKLKAGQNFLSEGLSQSLTNRAASDERLTQAKEAFESLLLPQIPNEIREKALYGLATTLESLSNGDEKGALEAYEQLLKDYPTSQHRLFAESRVKALKENSSKEFYAWFRQQNPKPADRPTPLDNPNFGTPEDIFNQLNIESVPPGTATTSDLKLDAPAVEGEPAQAPEMPAPAKEEAPATEPSSPVEAPKAEEKPAETQPAPEAAKTEAPKVEAPQAEMKPDEAKPAEEAEKPAEEPVKTEE